MNPGLCEHFELQKEEWSVKKVLYLAQCLTQGRCWATQAEFMEKCLPLPLLPHCKNHDTESGGRKQ